MVGVQYCLTIEDQITSTKEQSISFLNEAHASIKKELSIWQLGLLQ